MKHPLPLGTKIVSLRGEKSDTEDADGVETGPDAVGSVIHIDRLAREGWSYFVEFEPSGVAVFVSQGEGGIDSEHYRLAESSDEKVVYLVIRDPFVYTVDDLAVVVKPGCAMPLGCRVVRLVDGAYEQLFVRRQEGGAPDFGKYVYEWKRLEHRQE